jgi:carbon-monoxide dehydrogenase medium subunit
MKPSVFKYYDPHTLEDAVGLMGTLDNARALAGGQSLMAMINMRFAMPDHLVDLNHVAVLAGIDAQPELIRIGAMTRQRELEFSPLIAQRLPLMAEALQHVGHRQTRNRGTLGGSLCHLDPAAELVTVSAACDAVVEVASARGRREVEFGDFPMGYMMPNVEPDELLVGVRYTPWPTGHGSAFVEFSRRHGDFAIVSAAAMLLLDASGKIARASLALGGVGSAPLRMRAVEQALIGQVPTEAVLRDVSESCREIDPMDDALVTADYRRSLAVVMARRALAAAAGRAASSTHKVLQ